MFPPLWPSPGYTAVWRRRKWWTHFWHEVFSFLTLISESTPNTFLMVTMMICFATRKTSLKKKKKNNVDGAVWLLNMVGKKRRVENDSGCHESKCNVFVFPRFPSLCLWHECWQVLDGEWERAVVLHWRKNSPINRELTCCVQGSIVKRKDHSKMSRLVYFPLMTV